METTQCEEHPLVKTLKKNNQHDFISDLEGKPKVAKDFISIECDGGCNPNPGRGYGSYQITMNGKRGRIWRIDLGEGQTNNTAEYLILVKALDHVIQHLNPASTAIHVETDSKILVWYSANFRRAKRLRATPPLMQSVKDQLFDLLVKFHSVSSCWRGRDRSVEVFGH
jgi:ribonuclease HI